VSFQGVEELGADLDEPGVGDVEPDVEGVKSPVDGAEPGIDAGGQSLCAAVGLADAVGHGGEAAIVKHKASGDVLKPGVQAGFEAPEVVPGDRADNVVARRDRRRHCRPGLTSRLTARPA
jgi:hypothetical protein